MKRIVSILGFLTLFCFGLKSQGFIKPYDFESPNSIIGNIIYENDTLYVLALVLNQDTTQQGFLLAKMDTMGNIHSKIEIYHPSSHYAFSLIPGSFIKLKDDEGFVIVGSIIGTSSRVVLKLDTNGKLIWHLHPPLVNSQLDHFFKVVQINQDVLIVGKMVRPNFTNDAYLISLDNKGRVKWEKSFGIPNYVDLLTNVNKLNENEILVSGSTFFRGSWDQNTYTSTIYSFDTLGTQNWQWESPRSLEETGMIGLHIDTDGNYNYLSGRGEYERDGNYLSQPKFFKRDNNFQILQEKTFYEIRAGNTVKNMIPSRNGGYICVGQKNVPENDPNTLAQEHGYSWILRLDENGDSLWSSEHLIFPDKTFATSQEINSVVELPSGSIIAAGNFENALETKKWGFLIKVDKHGCIDTLSCQPVSSVEEPIKEAIRVFPNPASQNVTFSFSSLGNKQLIINDLSGSVIAETVIPSYQTQYVWSSENHPPGVYFYQVFSGRGVIQSGKVVVQR